MQITDIKSGINIKPLKYPLQETPHLTIEPNRTCNMKCRFCYTLNKNYVKSLDEVKKEIDLAVAKRKLETISLLGGEPTLHPQLPEIIRFIKHKKLKCQLLTNGIVLLDDNNDRFLDRLIHAGIDRILLHIDAGQRHIHEDIEGTRHQLFTKLERKKVHFSLSLTIYDENKGEIPRLIKKFSVYKFFDGILAVLARDPLHHEIHNTELHYEYESILKELNIDLTAYIPSNLNDEYICWLVYFLFFNANTGETFCISPGADRILRKLLRLITGRQFFAPILSRPLLLFLFLIICLLETFKNPKKILALSRLIKKSCLTKGIRFHFIAIQTPPEFNKEKNQYHICYHCPDATIRNKMLTPVCLADMINPLNTWKRNKNLFKDIYLAVYEHLGEI